MQFAFGAVGTRSEREHIVCTAKATLVLSSLCITYLGEKVTSHSTCFLQLLLGTLYTQINI
jgi:hypothetical protein